MLRTSRTLAAAPRLASLLAALAGGAAASLGAPAASGAEPAEIVHVAVTAPAGKGCISSEKLQSAVQKRVGGASRKGSGARSTAAFVQIASADPGPGWVAEVAIAGQAGRRSVRTSATACSQLDEGLVLVVTLLASPDDDEDPPPNGDEPAPSEEEPRGGGSSWGQDKPSPAEEPESDEPESDEPGPGTKRPEAPAEPKEGPGGDKPPAENKGAANKGSSGDEPAKKKAPKEDAEQSDGSGSEKKKLQFGVGLSAVYSAGLVRRPVGGVRGSFSWLSPTPVPVEAWFTYYQDYEEHEIVIQPEGYHEAGLMALGVTACPATVSVGRFSFGACAGLSTTRYQYSFHSDQDVPGPNEWESGPLSVDAEYYLLSTTAELRFDVTLWKMLRVGAAIEAVAPLNRPNMVDSLHSMNLQALAEPVIFQSRLGISLVLPP